MLYLVLIEAVIIVIMFRVICNLIKQRDAWFENYKTVECIYEKERE